MTGAMYAAIAGLRTHMQNLNVIGNNVANVNTYGYKSSRAVFKTSLYTSLNGGSNGTTVMGGTNPSQIGYGSMVSTVDIDMSTGNYAVTGKSTDLMLDGDGFFLVGSKDIALNFDGSSDDVNRLTALTLTRVGNFDIMADGYLAKEDGNCVYGFLCTGLATQEDVIAGKAKEVGDPIFSDQLVPIRVPRTKDVFRSADGTVLTDPADIYEDGTGANPTLKEGVTKGKAVAYPGTDIVTTTVDNDGNITATNPVEGNKRIYDAGYDTRLEDSPLTRGKYTGISFDPNTGIITATCEDTEETVTIGCVAVGTVTNPNGVTNQGDNYYKAGEGSGDLFITVLGGNAKDMRIEQVNQSLQTVDPNDQTATAETIDGLYIHSSKTKLVANGLEMSKTDLAQEIANMILTQRGYQANTRIVTVTDSMLEELVNMKR